MDISKEYIKMSDCKEIQNKPCFITEMRYSKQDKIYFDKNGSFWFINQQMQVWLPRQDQLQEMVNQKYDVFSQISLFKSWTQNTAHKFIIDSHEKLWLAFVMKEKHNKTWDSNKWI